MPREIKLSKGLRSCITGLDCHCHGNTVFVSGSFTLDLRAKRMALSDIPPYKTDLGRSIVDLDKVFGEVFG
jgi:hypothetical protein